MMTRTLTVMAVGLALLVVAPGAQALPEPLCEPSTDCAKEKVSEAKVLVSDTLEDIIGGPCTCPPPKDPA
ncbi:MAG: hypothetical protein KY455_13855 [Euryarchaeota archaeon]|nr:hypothetical protein [Euryarchaeota archaeon]